MKPEGSAVLVVYIVISFMAASCMLMGWCAHAWYSEDRLCKNYDNINKKLSSLIKYNDELKELLSKKIEVTDG